MLRIFRIALVALLLITSSVLGEEFWGKCLRFDRNKKTLTVTPDAPKSPDRDVKVTNKTRFISSRKEDLPSRMAEEKLRKGTPIKVTVERTGSEEVAIEIRFAGN